MAVGMDRLSLLDAGFWYLEDGHTSLHIASVTIFDGPAPSYPELVDAVERKLSALPRYRMRMRTVPFGIARPVWVDDRTFDLTFHVRHTALPAPGGDTELRALVERLMSQPMDADHPLWEAWLVDGMPDGQWAVVWKVHHSMVDGVGGMALLACMLDAGADSKPPPALEWHARPEPSPLRLVAAAATDRARSGAGVARSLAAAAR
ncbi:wax ester/triacylglycerol synthase domain-containing protein, partial [Jatrophihabitans sp.]|uniref:wax ester/triacylglycerol synthase domain-containing protein n=1 Tax=Jatrophihabitans sp. TaxID=1932789 RepID=UPI0030C77FCE|nr:Acyltransferase [Jatrophihabitans sp.]